MRLWALILAAAGPVLHGPTGKGWPVGGPAPADLLAVDGERDWLIDYLSPEGRVRLWGHLLH